MSHTTKNHFLAKPQQPLLTLCRFLAVRMTYRFILLLLTATGILLTLLNRTQFAPYGIALFCLILPSFLNDSVRSAEKKENSDAPLSSLYRRYHYSPVLFNVYRITISICALLLLIWHKFSALTVFEISVPLLYLALCLALVPILSRVLFLIFHHRLMNGAM